MRKLILSLAVIGVSGAYVVQASMNDDRGLSGLVDRLMFRWDAAPPLDLDSAPVRQDLLTSISVPAPDAPPPALVAQ